MFSDFGGLRRFEKASLLKFGLMVIFQMAVGLIVAQNANNQVTNIGEKRQIAQEHAIYVNPFIGTGGHGHTFPGAVVPFGMVQLSPDTRNDASWDACGGYYYHDTFIYGFSHTHLSGTGVSDLGDILFQPMLKPEFEPERYKQRFTHDLEQAEAGYYRVKFPESQIQVELTASEYMGLQRVEFPQKEGLKWILIDLKHRDELLSSSLLMEDAQTVNGHRQSRQWANNQWVFFRTRMSAPADTFLFNTDSTQLLIGFRSLNNIVLQTTLSFTSTKGVALNEAYERNRFASKSEMDFSVNVGNILPFDKVKDAAMRFWDSELGRIKVLGKEQNKRNLTTFYTALYHCMIHPSLASDADGSYRGRDQKIHKKDHKTYHVFSLWDTYRALHPLLSLIDKSRTRDFILTMLDQYEEGGRLPVWELGSCETNCMIGFHSVPVILDAVKQGVYFSEEEQKRLWQAVKHSSDYKELAYEYHIPIATELLTLYGLKLGYIDVLNQSESVSKTLEYAFDDFCVSELGKLWGFENEASEYKSRSERWKGLWDTETKSFRPRHNGNFLEPYFLNEVNNHYTEANAWQYRFAVPQDIEGLILKFGGADSFERALDGLFQASNKTRGREQADITGLIGQYAHGNEPSHHMAYLYNYIGKPEKTQQLILKIQNEFYTTEPDGYIGNEDCGQMSAWHVLSALGMYPVAPGSGYWDLGVPMFDSVEVFQSDAQNIRISKSPEFDGPNAHRMDMPHYQYVEHDLAPWVISEDRAITSYREKFVELIPNYSQLLPKNNRMSNDFLMIHRSMHFVKGRNNGTSKKVIKSSLKGIEIDGERRNELSNSYNVGYVPELISPEKVNKGQGYGVVIKGATKLNPVSVFVRFMDSSLRFGEARDEFYKDFAEVKTEEGLMRIPGYGAHHLLFQVTTDTQIYLKGSVLIWAAFLDKDSWVGKPFTARYIHEKTNNFEVLEIKGTYNSQYSGGGDAALVDGVFGSEEWRSGSWQGYQAQDFEAVIDLKEVTQVRYLGARFLSDERAWIFLPRWVSWEYSVDGKKFKPFNRFDFDSTTNARREVVVLYPIVMGHSKKSKGVKARYIRVKAKNFGKLPKGHPGYDFNGDAFIFIDEVLINPEVSVLLGG